MKVVDPKPVVQAHLLRVGCFFLIAVVIAMVSELIR